MSRIGSDARFQREYAVHASFQVLNEPRFATNQRPCNAEPMILRHGAFDNVGHCLSSIVGAQGWKAEIDPSVKFLFDYDVPALNGVSSLRRSALEFEEEFGPASRGIRRPQGPPIRFQQGAAKR